MIDAQIPQIAEQQYIEGHAKVIKGVIQKIPRTPLVQKRIAFYEQSAEKATDEDKIAWQVLLRIMNKWY
jgi:hypothetical protein